MQSINSIFNAQDSGYGSSGEIDNPMVRNIAGNGCYIPYSSRKANRYLARIRKKSLGLTRIKANSPTRSSKGFGI